MSTLDKLYISPSSSKPGAVSQTRDCEDLNGKKNKQKGEDNTSMMRKLLIEMDVKACKVPLLSATNSGSRPSSSSKRTASISGHRPYTPGSILPLELLTSHQPLHVREQAPVLSSPITHQSWTVNRKALAINPSTKPHDESRRPFSQASRTAQSSRPSTSTSVSDQMRETRSRREDDNESIQIVGNEDEVEGLYRQAAPMVLSLENIIESSAEVLELEMEKMTTDEILELKKGIRSEIHQRKS